MYIDKKEEVKFSLFLDNTILYLKEIVQTLLENMIPSCSSQNGYQKKKNEKAKKVGKEESFFTAGWSGTWLSYYRNQYEDFSVSRN